jgi:hypothetical protein
MGRWWISNPCGGRGYKELLMKKKNLSADEYDKNMDENDERIKRRKKKIYPQMYMIKAWMKTIKE